MPIHYRSALIVLTLAILGLWVLKPVFGPLMAPGSFDRRRNAWLAVSVIAFLSPDFWIFVGLTAAVVIWVSRRDPNPAAVYLLLLPIVPPLREVLPGLGIVNTLFEVNHPRLLALVLLAPLMLRIVRAGDRPSILKVPVDWLVLAFMFLQVALYAPYLNLTSILRQVFLLVIDLWLPYFVMSRTFMRSEDIRDAMACFALSMAVFVPIAMAEVVLSTLFYGGLSERWDTQGRFFGYLLRDGQLRAQLASGQPIVLGYQFALAFALWLYLQTRIERRSLRWIGVAAMVLGLILALSRGPWLGAIVIAVVFALAAPGGLTRFAKLLAGGAAVFGVVMASPWADKVIGLIPFVGDVGSESVTYRQRIVEVSWQLILDSPWFGNPFARLQLEELRQGQGIIDIVNTYIAFAIAWGGIGVALFVGCFAVTMVQLLRVARGKQASRDSAMMAAALFAALAGVLAILATTSNYLTIPLLYWSLIGCGLSLARVHRAQSSAQTVTPRFASGARGARPTSRA